MLLTQNLKASIFATIDKAGKYINLVQASGLIRVTARAANGGKISTDMVAGMSIDAGDFIQVDLRSDNDQVILIWVSTKPLTYSPDVSRAVGSGSLQSDVVQVFSNEPMQILPPVTGRNRITLTPTENIYIGGTNLNLENGVLIPANTTFTLATQGAVYGLETSGNYPPFFTAQLTENDINQNTPILESGEPAIITHMYTSSNNRWYIHKTNNDATSLTEINAGAFPNLAALATIDFQASNAILKNTHKQIGDMLYFASKDSSFGAARLNKVNLATGDYTHTIIKSAPHDSVAQGSFYHCDIKDDKIIVANGLKELYISNDAGATFALSGVAAPVGGSIVDIIQFNNGDILLYTNTAAAITTDDGANWTVTGHAGDSGLSGRRIKRDGANVYAIGSLGQIYKSIDKGANWIVETAFNDVRNFDIKDGIMLAAVGAAGIVYADDLTDAVIIQDNNYSQAIVHGCEILNAGAYFVGYTHSFNTNKYQYLAFGKQIPTGGLKVATLQELN